MMNLVMFDIDGTLTQTNSIDSDLYVQAVQECLNVTEIDTNWESYCHATDSAIAAEIIERKIGQVASKEMIDAICIRFTELVTAKISEEPDHFRSIDGAKAMLSELAAFSNVAVAIATGTWKEAALLKLRAASLILPDMVIATASDAYSREELMRIAEKRALVKTARTSWDSVVYVGDAIWDVHASNALGYHFIGVGTGKKADKLRDKGATWIIPDYNDQQQFFGIIKNLCNVPQKTS